MIKRPVNKQPAPKLSMKSPNARTNFITTLDTPVPTLSYTLEDTGPSVNESRETAISEDFASPIVVRRETPTRQDEKENSELEKEKFSVVDDEKDKCEPTKEDGSTIAKYVERFRSTQPLSRVERARSGLQARPKDFWWTDGDSKKTSKARTEIGVAFKLPFTKKRVRFADEDTPLDKDTRRSSIPQMIRTPQGEAEEVEDNSSELPAVSTDGLDSNLSSNDTGVLRPLHLSGFASPTSEEGEEEEDLTFRPEFIRSPVRHLPTSPPVRLQEVDGDDILTRWRLKNQLELAREMSRKGDDSPSHHHFKRTFEPSRAVRPVVSTPLRQSLPVVDQQPPQPSVLQPQPSVLQPPQPSVFQPPQPSVLQPPQPSVFQPPQPSVLQPQPSVLQRQPSPQPQVAPCRRQDAGTQVSPPPRDAEVQTASPPYPCNKQDRKERKKRRRKREKGQAAVLSQVVAKGLGLHEEDLQTSVNSIFGPDSSLRVSSEQDLASTVRAATKSASAGVSQSLTALDVSLKLSTDIELSESNKELHEGQTESPTLEDLVITQDEKAEKFMHDVIVRQLRYQLHSKLEQIRLIDEELRARGHHI